MHKSTLTEKSGASDLAKIGNAFTAVKRYYANNFLDVEKQYAINIFLGNFMSSPEKPHIWDIDTEKSFHEIHSIFPVEKNLFYVPFGSQSEKSFSPFETYFAERYDPSNLTCFDEELEKSYNVPIEVKIQNSGRQDFVWITKSIRQTIEETYSSEFTSSAPPKSIEDDNYIMVTKATQDKAENPKQDSENRVQIDMTETPRKASTISTRPRIHEDDAISDQYSEYVNVENFITNTYSGIPSSSHSLESLLLDLRSDMKRLLDAHEAQ
jgi:hypothetical protein